MTVEVVVAPIAEAQLLAVEAWWVANRPKNPALFSDEYERAINTLTTFPEGGVEHGIVKGQQVRRLPLAGTKHALFYWYDAANEVVHIVSVWGSQKGSGPDLISI